MFLIQVYTLSHLDEYLTGIPFTTLDPLAKTDIDEKKEYDEKMSNLKN